MKRSNPDPAGVTTSQGGQDLPAEVEEEESRRARGAFPEAA